MMKTENQNMYSERNLKIHNSITWNKKTSNNKYTTHKTWTPDGEQFLDT